MRRFGLSYGLFKKHKTIRRVIDSDGVVSFRNYYHAGRCIWTVRTYARFHDACKGCCMGRREYCGYYCHTNVFESNDPNALPVHCKKVEEGDTLIGESGKKYSVYRDNTGLHARLIWKP